MGGIQGDGTIVKAFMFIDDIPDVLRLRVDDSLTPDEHATYPNSRAIRPVCKRIETPIFRERSLVRLP